MTLLLIFNWKIKNIMNTVIQSKWLPMWVYFFTHKNIGIEMVFDINYFTKKQSIIIRYYFIIYFHQL